MTTPNATRGETILEMLDSFQDLLSSEQAHDIAQSLGTVTEEDFAATFLRVRTALETLQMRQKQQQEVLAAEGKSILRDAGIAFEHAASAEDAALATTLESELSDI